MKLETHVRLYRDLEKENELLKNKIEQLKEKNRSLSKGHWRTNGNIGEEHIATLLDGAITPSNCRYDVLLLNGLKLEVKYASLSRPNIKKAQTKAWKWSEFKGLDGKKEYDSLILVGEIDKKYKNLHADPDEDYIYFDIPFGDVDKLIDKSRMVTLTTNPETVRSKVNIRLFNEYQKTKKQLREKYK